jgi:hypothetical protein
LKKKKKREIYQDILLLMKKDEDPNYEIPLQKWFYGRVQHGMCNAYEKDRLTFCLLAKIDDENENFTHYENVRIICGKWNCKRDVGDFIFEASDIQSLQEYIDVINTKTARVKFSKDDFVNEKPQIFIGSNVDEFFDEWHDDSEYSSDEIS